MSRNERSKKAQSDVKLKLYCTPHFISQQKTQILIFPSAFLSFSFLFLFLVFKINNVNVNKALFVMIFSMIDYFIVNHQGQLLLLFLNLENTMVLTLHFLFMQLSKVMYSTYQKTHNLMDLALVTTCLPEKILPK